MVFFLCVCFMFSGINIRRNSSKGPFSAGQEILCEANLIRDMAEGVGGCKSQISQWPPGISSSWRISGLCDHPTFLPCVRARRKRGYLAALFLAERKKKRCFLNSSLKEVTEPLGLWL